MQDTGFWVDASKVGRVTSVFTYGPDKRLIRATPPRGQETRYENPSAKPVFLSGSGGLFSTTDDYFRFAQMMLNGGEANGKRFLRRSTVELMRTNVLAEGVEVDSRGPGIGFGLDFAIVIDPVVAKTPEGRNSFYWGGAFGTWFWIDPTNDVVVVGMIQNVNGSQPTGGSPKCDRSPDSSCIRRWWIRRSDCSGRVPTTSRRARGREDAPLLAISRLTGS